MSDQQEKVALSETQRAFITPIMGGVAAGSVAFGLPAALDKVREVRVRRNRDKYITAMKDVHPDLKGIPKKDLHIAYNSMAMHSPHVLRDPLLGGQELLRMSKYRQADVNSLNEINKLRGNSLMDQAFMNATNLVAGGVGEGFRGYQAQRQADADQKYRQTMDEFRMSMDRARFDLEKERMRVQGEQFGESYDQRERQFGAGYDQKERQHADNMGVRATEFGYRQDEDARAEARWEVEQGTREMGNQLKQIELAQRGVKQERAFDAQGKRMEDAQGNPVYVNQPGVSVDEITKRLQNTTPTSPVTKPDVGKDRATRKPPTPREETYTSQTTNLNMFDPERVPTPQVKKASADHIFDIVARLRDRNP